MARGGGDTTPMDMDDDFEKVIEVVEAMIERRIGCYHDFAPYDFEIVLDEHFSELTSRLHDSLLSEIDVMVAEGRIDVAGRSYQGFEAYAVRSGSLGEHVARYVDGTHSWPVIMVDWDKHQNEVATYADELGILRETLLHELVHALQDSAGLDMDEGEAENAWR